MTKITFMGAGSTIFVRNVIGDCMCREALAKSTVALYDIDSERLKESAAILSVLNKNINNNRMKLSAIAVLKTAGKRLPVLILW